jgi:hypothetical protein
MRYSTNAPATSWPSELFGTNLPRMTEPRGAIARAGLGGELMAPLEAVEAGEVDPAAALERLARLP